MNVILNESLRDRSGAINDNDAFVDLIYTLLRDGHISPGALESLIREREIAFSSHEKEGKLTAKFSNGWLACYAQDVVERLREVT